MAAASRPAPRDADCASPEVSTAARAAWGRPARLRGRARRLPQRVLRRRGLLLSACNGKLPLLRGGRRARHLRAGRRRTVARRAVHRRRGHHLREHRLLRRRRQLPAGTRRAPQGAPPAVRWRHTSATLARTCDGAGTCRPPVDAIVRHPAPATAPPATPPAAADVDCAPGNVCNAGAWAEASGTAVRRGQPGAPAPNAWMASAAPAAAATASRATSRGWGACATRYGDEMEPRGGARPAHLRVQRPLRRQRHVPDAPATTSCGTASCSGSTFPHAGNCSGAGACVQARRAAALTPAAGSSCRTRFGGRQRLRRPASPACRTSCTNLKANGAACVARDQLLQRQLHRGVLLHGRQLWHPAASCALPRALQGTCQPVPPAAPTRRGRAVMMQPSTCGTTGTCDGASHCATYPANTPCGRTTCAAATLTAFTCGAGGPCSRTRDCDAVRLRRHHRLRAAPCAADPDCATNLTCNAPTCMFAVASIPVREPRP